MYQYFIFKVAFSTAPAKHHLLSKLVFTCVVNADNSDSALIKANSKCNFTNDDINHGIYAWQNGRAD